MRRSNEANRATRFTLAVWPRLLDLHLAATYLSISESTVRDYVAEGLLVPVPLPGSTLRDRRGKIVSRAGQRRIAKLLFAKEDLDRFVDERKGLR